MSEEKDLYELSSEINAVSLIVTALSYQLNNKKGDTLTEESLRNSLFGITCHLDRISEDLTAIDERYTLKERAVVANE